MRLADIDNSPYFVPFNEDGDYVVNYDYLHETHGPNAILELDRSEVMEIVSTADFEGESEFSVELYGARSIRAAADTDLDFEVVRRVRTVIEKV